MGDFKLEAILNHPKFIDGKDVEHCDESQAIRAYLVFIDLTEVHRWCEADMHFNSQLNLVYVTGKMKDEQSENVVLPIDVHKSTDCEFIRTVMATLCPNNQMLTLAFCESDSTTVYYRIRSGLHAPKSLRDSEKCREADENSEEISGDIGIESTCRDGEL